MVLAKLPVSVSTAKVYQSLKWDQVEHHPDTKGMLAAMAKGDVPAMGRLLGNVLETVTIPMYPKIADIKESMLENEAEGALMSGSGPTAFGLFDRLEAAQEARACLAQRYRDTFLCETV